MKVLIVGGHSALGVALKVALSEFCEVVTGGRNSCDVHVDLAEGPEEMEIPTNLDVVINTAAHFGGASYNQLSDAININVLGTLRLCEKAAKMGAKHFIQVSSIFASIGQGFASYSPYALTKRYSEDVAVMHCATNSLPLCIVRPSQIYGETENFRRHQPFLYHIIDQAQAGRDIIIYGSHDALRNYIFIEDLTDVLRRVVQLRLEGIYNCQYVQDYSYSTVANAAFEAFGRHGKVSFDITRDDLADKIFHKNFSLYERIGFYPKISIQEGLNRIASSRRTKIDI